MEWKKESKYVIHESGFTVIVEEGSFDDPSSIRIKQSEGFDALEQAKLLREGLEFGRSNTDVDSKSMTSREHKSSQMPAKKTYQTLTSELPHLDSSAPKITVKKTRKIRIPATTEKSDSKVK